MSERRPIQHGVLVGLFVVLLASGLAAHHSFAVFDHTQTFKVTGTVTRFQWTNPHGFLEIEYRAADGATKHYTMELTSINMLTRAGWTSRSVKAGETITANVAPLLSGEPGGLLLDLTFADGRKLDSPVPAPGTFKRTPEQELK